MHVSNRINIPINTGDRVMSACRSQQKFQASSLKVRTLGNEYVRAKDDSVIRQKLSLILKELSSQIAWLSEQNVELMRKLEK